MAPLPAARAPAAMSLSLWLPSLLLAMPMLSIGPPTLSHQYLLTVVDFAHLHFAFLHPVGKWPHPALALGDDGGPRSLLGPSTLVGRVGFVGPCDWLPKIVQDGA